MTEPTFIASTDGVQDVFRRARARRRRRTLATTGGLAAMGAVVAVVLVGTGAGVGADRLKVVPTRPLPSPAHGSDTTVLVPPPLARAGSGASGQSTIAAGTGGTSPAIGVVGSGPTPAPSDVPTSPPRRHSAAAPVTRTTTAYSSSCDATYTVQEWCEIYTGPSSARRKHPVNLSMELCRPQVLGDGTVHFTDSREIDFTVFDSSGATMWHAGQGVADKSNAHAVVVKAGTCLRWTSTWDTVAPDGFYAVPDSYSVGLSLDSTDVTTTTSGPGFTLTD